MDTMNSGELGVIAWCNNIRSSMAKDPGRQFLEEQVQNGFDFLDNYIENVLQGPRTESVTELLKTPGRKKVVSSKTRAASTTAQRAKSTIIVSLDEDEILHDSHVPVNSFHQALLQAKDSEHREVNVAPSSRNLPSKSAGPSTMRQQPLAVARTPSPEMAAQDVGFEDVPTIVPRSPSPPAASTNASVHREPELQIVAGNFLEASGSLPTKELSIIAEDDEQHSQLSLSAPEQDAPDDAAETEYPDMVTEPQTLTDDAQPQASEEMDGMDVDENHTATSTQSFHSARPLSPHGEDRISASSEYMTAPLPRQSQSHEAPDGAANPPVDPIPVVEQPPAEEEPQEGDFDVPIKDASPPPGQDGKLNRKPSLNFTGLSAPSPLRKSMRFTREPSVGPAPGPSTAAATGVVGGKRSSWLVKAREAKALEGANKRASALTGGMPGLTTLGSKRKSVDMLENPALLTLAVPAAKTPQDEERAAKILRLAKPNEDPRDSKGKGRASTESEAAPTAVTSKDATEVQANRALPPPRTSHSPTVTDPSDDFTVALRHEEEGALERFRKTVEGARVGKSMGKSFGGNAAAALAEARKAAEARVAERLRAEGRQSMDVVEAPKPESEPAAKSASHEPVPQAVAQTAAQYERRLSVSDLAQSTGKDKEETTPSETGSAAANASVSTTPPNSPPPTHPASFVAPAPPPAKVPPPPVFSKPPVFVLPAPKPAAALAPVAGSSKDFGGFMMPNAHPFTLPVAMNIGVPANFSTHAPPLTAQSSKDSLFSDMVFDRDDTIPAWLPRTQDTEFSIYESQPQPAQEKPAQDDELDEDDSWHIDEKLRQNQMWTPFGMASEKDDTWSTMGSRSTSQKGGDTGMLEKTTNITRTLEQVKELVEQEQEQEARSMREQEQEEHEYAQDEEYDGEVEEADVAMEIDEPEEPQEGDTDLEDLILNGKPTIALVNQKQDERPRSQSQQSNASVASSSQSQVGFFGQATKLMTSMLGGSKKTKMEPVKSLQLAAAAAKKQQEESEKKATRLKEMENRRQQAMQKKAEEEKSRALEEERKIKEENDRRKREREEQTDKRPVRVPPKKGEEADTKKRKIGEAEKKPEAKKPPSKDKIVPPRAASKPPSSVAAPSTASKTVSVLKSTAAKTVSSSQESSSNIPASTSKTVKTVKATPSSSNLKAGAPRSKTPAPAKDEPQAGPSQTARAKTEPPVASESIELPDINSEYSDSEDENRPRTFDPPDWAQSPVLREALQQQSTLNPDDIFGRIGPLRMEEIFRTRQSRFRARTSSANWAGTDELTKEEEVEYARRMGFR